MTYETHRIPNNELDQFVQDAITAGNAIHFIFVSPYNSFVYVTIIIPAP